MRYAEPVPDRSPLILEDVTFGYDAAEPVVRGVTGTAGVGRVTALIGPNAAGKSTLLKLMLGLVRPWSGRVLLEGDEAWSLGPRVRARRVAYVPQRGGVSFAFTVRQVVEMSRFAHERRGTQGDVVERAMAMLELEPLASRVYGELSGGQQARVLLARAMAQATGSGEGEGEGGGGGGGGGGRVVLLDEPTSHLDLEHVQRAMRLMRGLATQGTGRAVVVVLHDLNLAARWADDVWLMAGGRVAAAGRWQDVLTLDVLEPVYRVGLRAVGHREEGRPVWVVE